jgi:hypothetical protein
MGNKSLSDSRIVNQAKGFAEKAKKLSYWILGLGIVLAFLVALLSGPQFYANGVWFKAPVDPIHFIWVFAILLTTVLAIWTLLQLFIHTLKVQVAISDSLEKLVSFASKEN